MLQPNTRILLIVAAVLSLTGLLTLVILLRSWQGDVIDSNEAKKPDHQEVIRNIIREEEGFMDLPLSVAEQAVLDQHFQALGGVFRLSQIKSLRVYGTVSQANGGEYAISIVKKIGGFMLVSMKADIGQVKIVLTPDGGWQETASKVGNVLENRELTPEEFNEHRRYVYLWNELFLAKESDWPVYYLGERNFNYKMAHVFEVKTDDMIMVRFYIDPETFLDVGREDLLFKEDGTIDIFKRINKSHFDSNGIKFAEAVDVYKNGELIQQITVEGADLNVGVLQSTFSRPDN